MKAFNEGNISYSNTQTTKSQWHNPMLDFSLI